VRKSCPGKCHGFPAASRVTANAEPTRSLIDPGRVSGRTSRRGADADRAATAAAEAGFPVGGVGDPAVGTQRASRPVSVRVDQRNRDDIARRLEQDSGVPRSQPPMRTTESVSIRVIYVIVSNGASKMLHLVPSLSRWSVGPRRRAAADCRRQPSAPNLDSIRVSFRNISRAQSVLRLGGGGTNAKRVHGIRTALDCPSSVVSRPVQGLSSDLARRRSGPFLFARMLGEMGHAVLEPLALDR